MRKIDIMLKCIILLHREKKLKEVNVKEVMDSSDLVKEFLDVALGNDGKNAQLMGGESNILLDVKYLISDMISHPDNHDSESLLQSLTVILKDKTTIIKNMENAINMEVSNPRYKKSIVTLRRAISHYIKEEKIKETIRKASYELTTGKVKGMTIQEYVNGLMGNLDSMVSNGSDDNKPGVVDEQDIFDPDSMKKAIDKLKDMESNTSVIKTGWKGLNTMLRGGFRRGRMTVVEALQHNYKSGFSQTMFCQAAMNNKPAMNDESMKPLILYISFEDNSDVYISFIYKYLYYNKYRKAPKLEEVTSGEISKFIKQELSINGYHVKMIRVNPSLWTYKDVFNKVLELESEGYEIHMCIIDYLAKLPTTGCITSGPTGTDVRDLFNRVRNFFSSKDISILTPHQMSTEAKQLLRNGIVGEDLLKEVAGKGYTEGSRQIDHVVDVELMLNKYKDGSKTKLAIGIAKDRGGIIDDDKKFISLEFPYKMPIPEDINSSSEKNINSIDDSEEDDDISF